MRPRALLCALVLAALAVVALPALAAYPDKAIRLIVPSAPAARPTR
jgi:tripartite-type tricarboxylate transporter receptor subunit TctC